MIPILYSTSETSFTSNGLGRLTDCISCLVTEERNGIFECEFKYPVTGKLYNEMVTNGGIISVTHDDAKDRQPFDIYKYSAPIDGIVTFNARHISYRLSGITVKPFTAASCALALQGIGTNSLSTNPFSFWTDKAVTSTFTLIVPTSAKAILVGQQGSILDVYGKGEYKFDKFDVKLYTNRGTNSGVTIRYGKNLSDTLVEKDNGEYYNAIVPYWKGEDGTLVTLTGWYVVQTGETLKYCVPVDFSSEFQSQPTELELRTKATAYLANNTPWLPKENIKVDFVQLWNTDEYKNVAVLERVKLCDTVAIYYPALGLTNSSAKVIKVVYDTLLERYTSIELGEPKQTLAEAIMQPYAQAIASISDKASVSFMEEAIQAATDLITGGLGGHVVINRNANGEPEEILIMDTDDTSTAVNVWRWNLNGLAHSHSGYNGPFDDIAITQDGKINASMITTGTLNAALANIINLNADNITSGTLSASKIAGGILKIGGVNNTGAEIYLYDYNGVLCGLITAHGLSTSGTSNGQTVHSLVADGEIQLLQDGYSLAALLGMSNSNPFLLFYYPGGRMAAAYGKDGLSYYLSDRDNHIAASYGKDSLIHYFSDQDYHIATHLGQDATRSFLTLNSPDGSSDIFLDTLPANGSRFNSPTRFNAGATVSNGLTADNATVNGVLDVTQRRCYATLSQKGWYRVLTNQASELAVQAFEIELTINRTNYYTNNETHKILLQAVYNKIKFVDEKSLSNALGIDKIRYTYKSGYGYVDIHYALSTSNYVAVDFDVKIRPDRQYQVYANSLEAVADDPSGETELTTYSFADNTETQSEVIASANITSTNGTIWGSESYIKLVWDNEKAEISGYVLLQNPASGILKVSVPTPSGFPVSKFATNWLIVGQAYRRSGGYMMPCDFCYANVASSAISIAERNMFASHPATDYAMITIPSAVYYF